MSDSQAISAAVAKLYNTYPFPPEPLLDEPPPGYNWRWNWLTAYSFCTGQNLLSKMCGFSMPDVARVWEQNIWFI